MHILHSQVDFGRILFSSATWFSCIVIMSYSFDCAVNVDNHMRIYREKANERQNERNGVFVFSSFMLKFLFCFTWLVSWQMFHCMSSTALFLVCPYQYEYVGGFRSNRANLPGWLCFYYHWWWRVLLFFHPFHLHSSLVCWLPLLIYLKHKWILTYVNKMFSVPSYHSVR